MAHPLNNALCVKKYPFNITGQKLSVDREILQQFAGRVRGHVCSKSVRALSESESFKDMDSDNRPSNFSYRSVNCSEYPRDIKFKLSTTRCLGANFISSPQRLRSLFRFFRIRLFETQIIQNMKFSVRINIKRHFPSINDILR